MIGQLNRRLARLEASGTGDYSDVVDLINAGVHFDELTPAQQARYIKYKESLGGVADDVALAELSIMVGDETPQEAKHFLLTKRNPPPTPEEFAQRVKEIEQLLMNGD